MKAEPSKLEAEIAEIVREYGCQQVMRLESFGGVGIRALLRDDDGDTWVFVLPTNGGLGRFCIGPDAVDTLYKFVHGEEDE